jgi:signal transduction histidine kinase/DNA-binding response OmpR family regulator/ligand-binding sensor domain-containing protein
LKSFTQIFLLFILLSSLIFPQQQDANEFGFPLITNYTTKDYSANVQNWSIVQDKNGIMYFGNVSGVLEYDGVSWRLIEVPNNIVRCLAIDSEGVIYVGGINEIGYLTPDKKGKLVYSSLNKIVSNDNPDFGDIWKIVIHKDGLYFQTFSTLYLLESTKNNSLSFFENITRKPLIEKWTTRTRMNPIHSVGDRIFVHERNVGLQELSDGKLKMLPGGEEFAQDLICIMLPYSSDKLLIGSLRKGLYLFDSKKFEKFINEADNFLLENRLYFQGAILRDGTFALGTQLGGIAVVDKNGKLKRIIDKKIGLNNNTVWNLFCDYEGSLWAALDNGISKILYPSSLHIIDERLGFEGSIQAINVSNNNLYLATSSGIFYLQLTATNKVFLPVKNAAVQSWEFFSIQNKLLAATNDGVFEIVNNIANVIDVNLRYSYSFCRSKKDTSIIFVGLHNGLAILKLENDKLKYIGNASNINQGILSIEEDEQGNLWCSELSGKIICIKTPDIKTDLTSYLQKKIIDKELMDSRYKIFKHLDKIYFYNRNGIFNYDYVNKKIIRSNILSSLIKDTSYQYLTIFSDGQNKIWSVCLQESKAFILEIDVQTKKVKSHSLLQLLNNKITSDFLTSRLYIQQNGKNKILWLGATNILVKYNPLSNLNSYANQIVKPSIRRILFDENNIAFEGHKIENRDSDENSIEFDYNSNSIIFEYSLASFINEAGNDYQYFLDGFDKDWSAWSSTAKKEYTNLSAGDYTFKIRGRNTFGVISDVAVYSFKVLPPWYKTWWANLLGFAFVLLLINYVIRYRVRYLKNKNIVLEKMVTERTAKINEQKDILEKQAQKLLELDQIKSNFFANISHEFRTPLTLIKGQLENVLGMVKEESVKKKINIAFNNSNRLNRLINQILDLSKLESGKTKLELEETDIIQLLKTRIASFESLADKNKISISLDSKIDKCFLTVDKERIEEVIDNLLSNALKFTGKEGKIDVSINLENTEFTNNAVITISDTGIGISEEKLTSIFDRFFQADNSSTKQVEGSGLGLAIVKEVIELHGGSISVESKLNVGTTFKIFLPIDESENVLPEIQKPVEIESIKNDDDKSLILVVEDNYDVRNYIKENLEQHYRIEEAVNGEDGILKAIEKIPDLIITDVMMPKVDGFQLCTNLKSDQRTSHIPIIILTAKADEENKLGGLLLGADEFLAKPFSPRELEVRVGNLIHIRQLLREKYKEISVIKAEDIKANPIDKEFLDKVFTQIKDHLEDQQFSVQKLADDMAMSVSQLNRKLNALINQSAGKLIRSTKLDYAAKLLEKNAGNITEIAYRIGFADVSSFTNSFKEKFGISPSEYLKKNH